MVEGTGCTMGGVMKGGDFSCVLILAEVTQEVREEERQEEEESGSAILREPGPGLILGSGSTFTREYTGTVTPVGGTAGWEGLAADLMEP